MPSIQFGVDKDCCRVFVTGYALRPEPINLGELDCLPTLIILGNVAGGSALGGFAAAAFTDGHQALHCAFG